ncbi:MAG: HAMP domain-containing sensor histidine kinase [Vicinamibacterales bacterium]
MTQPSLDARWPKVLSLAVHEFRTPMTVVAGYIRMLLKERAGPLNDQQRKLLEEAEKSCGRLSALVAEMSDLSSLEAGTAPLKRTTVNVAALLEEAIAALPPLQDRDVHVELQHSAPAPVEGDPVRLRTALLSVLMALRRELVTTDRLLVRLGHADVDGVASVVLAIGDHAQIDTIASADPAGLTGFDEWRGGCGLSLGNARRIIGQHGGTLRSPPDEGKAGAVVTLPALRQG